MSADSSTRRAVKRLLRRVVDERAYSILHAISIARDIRAATYTEPELELVPAAVSPGDTAIDIGANLGMYLPALSRATGPSGRVYAFEPIPYTAMTLRRVIGLLRLDNVEVVAKGCGAAAGTVRFSVPVQASGALMTGQAHDDRRRDRDHDAREDRVRSPRTVSVQAEVIALDEYLPRLDRLSLIKCDIEGAELFALRGATRLIERHHPTVVCEINPRFLEGFGITLEELVGFLGARGYELYSYQGAPHRLVSVGDLREVDEDNYVFVHPDRLSRFAAFPGGVPQSTPS
jgi:FkbM family methyltransferase